jgi:probable F420-dependent oxidoreductase
VRKAEALGYSAAWLTDSLGRDPLVHASWLLAATERLIVGTGVANIYLRSAVALVGGQRALAEQSGDRFILGIGISHAEMVEKLLAHTYERPVTTMAAYLDAMKAAPYSGPALSSPPPVVVAALGPKMLALAAERSAGAYPVHVTPEFTKRARGILGRDAWLCVKQYVVLERSPAAARAAARARLGTSFAYANYRRHLRSLGFAERDLENGGSDRLIDAVVAWGDEARIRERIAAHLDAGATHVCMEPIPTSNAGSYEAALEALAPAPR